MADALREVKRMKQHADWTRAAFEGSILAAHAQGESTRAIAKACGLSHQRVWQIIQQER